MQSMRFGSLSLSEILTTVYPFSDDDLMATRSSSLEPRPQRNERCIIYFLLQKLKKHNEVDNRLKLCFSLAEKIAI